MTDGLLVCHLGKGGFGFMNAGLCIYVGETSGDDAWDFVYFGIASGCFFLGALFLKRTNQT